MGNRDGIIQPDAGKVDIQTDFARSTVKISIREPLSITKHEIDIPLTDFLEVAGQIQVDTARVMREAQAHLRNAVNSAAKKA